MVVVGESCECNTKKALIKKIIIINKCYFFSKKIKHKKSFFTSLFPAITGETQSTFKQQKKFKLVELTYLSNWMFSKLTHFLGL